MKTHAQGPFLTRNCIYFCIFKIPAMEAKRGKRRESDLHTRIPDHGDHAPNPKDSTKAGQGPVEWFPVLQLLRVRLRRGLFHSHGPILEHLNG